jgi:hypothetical protein
VRVEVVAGVEVLEIVVWGGFVQFVVASVVVVEWAIVVGGFVANVTAVVVWAVIAVVVWAVIAVEA